MAKCATPSTGILRRIDARCQCRAEVRIIRHLAGALINQLCVVVIGSGAHKAPADVRITLIGDSSPCSTRRRRLAVWRGSSAPPDGRTVGNANITVRRPTRETLPGAPTRYVVTSFLSSTHPLPRRTRAKPSRPMLNITIVGGSGTVDTCDNC